MPLVASYLLYAVQII